jgi:hypothetical protein
MDPQIVFDNIECPTLRQQAKDLLEDIVQLSPSDAAVKATFRYFQNNFLAEIKIASESAYMIAIDQAVALGDLLDRVKSKLMGQIVDWRIHRFAS